MFHPMQSVDKAEPALQQQGSRGMCSRLARLSWLPSRAIYISWSTGARAAAGGAAPCAATVSGSTSPTPVPPSPVSDWVSCRRRCGKAVLKAEDGGGNQLQQRVSAIEQRRHLDDKVSGGSQAAVVGVV